jgi:Tol biopolymer transport system component
VFPVRTATVLVLAFLAPAALAAPAAKWTIDDIFKVKRLEGPVISPDGRYVLYTMSGAAPAENRRFSDLYVVTTDGSQTYRLTEDGVLKSSSHWSPDSKRVSGWLRQRAGSR